MEHTVNATLVLISLASLAVCFCSAVYAYLLQLDTSLVLDGAVHVSATRTVLGRADHDAHRTILQHDFISADIMVTVRPIKPICSKRTAQIMASTVKPVSSKRTELNRAFDDLMVWCRAQDLAAQYQTAAFAN